MDNANIGAIVGSVLGIFGGVVGTYFSVRNTNGPRERRFVKGAAAACWLTLGLTAGVVFLVPSLRFWTWVPISLLVVVGVPACNRRQTTIRREEAERPMNGSTNR